MTLGATPFGGVGTKLTTRSERPSARRSALGFALAGVAVFGASFAIGGALGEDERPEPRRTAAPQSVVRLGPLRLDRARALPDLRAARAKRARATRARDAGDAPSAATVEDVAPAPSTQVPASFTPAPPAPAPPPPTSAPPPSSPPPATTPPASSPAPDPAPAPPPQPAPDPSPSGHGGGG
jgi:hypothetical protein